MYDYGGNFGMTYLYVKLLCIVESTVEATTGKTGGILPLKSHVLFLVAYVFSTFSFVYIMFEYSETGNY